MELDEPNKLLNSDFTDENVLNYPTTMPKVGNDGVLPSYRVQLTTKKAVELLLEGTLRSKVCRYCLCVASPLSDLDQIMQVAGKGTLYKVTIRDMVACFHPFKTLSDPNFPRKICNKCLNRTISAYLFTQQCEQSERALRNCFDDMYTKLEKLDSLDKTKKRGRQKLNPNYNVLHANYENVIDYAEPIRNLVNVRSVSLSNEPNMSDLECPKCWQIFTKIEDLIVHEKSHPSNMWFNCRLCGRSFVKRLQLKRHLKTHVNQEIRHEEKHNFQCGTCGFGSEDHSVHLQHIEKHKFQSVLEHIVEKKMDKLCAVCLDKKPKLVELDKLVQLHGGYPGVTGDKSLYSILGSTLPDRKSYKYQELYVPHHARIMKLAKLTRNEPNNETQDISGISGCSNQIFISNPLVISNDKFDCEEMYLFFFSDPSYYKNSGKGIFTVDKNIIAHYDKVEDLNVSESKDETENNEEMQFEEQFENNETLINIYHELNQNDVTEKCELKLNKTIENTTPVNETACKICWIFKKPNCKTCIDKQSNTTEKDSDEKVMKKTDDTKENCSYCWIFKTSDKCGVCKIPTDLTVTTNVYKEEETKAIKDTDFQIKRKISYDTKPKNNKWDCQICLTTNIEERLTCICCESSRNNQDNTLKVNLDCKHVFKIFKANVSRNQENDLHISMTSEANENEKNAKLVHMVDSVKLPKVNTENFEEKRTMNEDTCKTFVSANLTNRNNNEDYEEMDTADDDTRVIITPNTNPFSHINISNFYMNIATSSNVTSRSTNVLYQLNNLEQSSNMAPTFGLQFNIGAGSSKKAVGRRMIKPMNNAANYTGTKICEQCLDSAITSYVFINHSIYTRDRLNTCVSAMLDNLNKVDKYEGNIFIEIAKQSILPLKEQDYFDDNLLLEEYEVDEAKLKVEVLEDEFRKPDTDESESEPEIKNYINAFLKEESQDIDIFKGFSEIKEERNIEIDNPAKRVTKTYTNKRLVNGYQVKNPSDEEYTLDDVSEFLTFKNKKKPIKKYYKYKLKCPMCSKSFVTDFHLQRHILKHVNKKVNCYICSRQFKSKFFMYEHIKMVHILNKAKFFSCKTCGRSYENEDRLKAHESSHISKECQLCDKFFVSQRHFDSHMQRHAVKLNFIKSSTQICSFCEKDYTNDNQLSLHVNKVHLQIKPYSCDMCERQFYTESNLSKHKNTHNLKSKEKCELCKKKFNTRKAMVIHLRKHTGETPHRCPLCGKAFYSEIKAKNHMRNYHGGTLYCKLCKSVFSSKYDLKSHVIMVHNNALL